MRFFSLSLICVTADPRSLCSVSSVINCSLLFVQGTSVLSPFLHIGSVIALAVMIYKKSAVQLFEKHPCLYILTFGFVSAKITNKLVVSMKVGGLFLFFFFTYFGFVAIVVIPYLPTQLSSLLSSNQNVLTSTWELFLLFCEVTIWDYQKPQEPLITLSIHSLIWLLRLSSFFSLILYTQIRHLVKSIFWGTLLIWYIPLV